MITLYSTHCPRCNILEKKMNEKGINYEVETDTDLMQKMGFTSVPMLKVDEEIMDFPTANQWINNQ